MGVDLQELACEIRTLEYLDHGQIAENVSTCSIQEVGGHAAMLQPESLHRGDITVYQFDRSGMIILFCIL